MAFATSDTTHVCFKWCHIGLFRQIPGQVNFLSPYWEARASPMAQIITHDEGMKGQAKVYGFITYIWHTDPQHAAGDTQLTGQVHAFRRITIKMAGGRAKTDTACVRSLKICAK